MREIKFRAWDGAKKRMIHFDNFHVEEGEGGVLRLGFDSDFHDDFYKRDRPDLLLMQYTGLKDKNGREIYEGDVITGKRLDYFNYSEEQQATVEWDECGSWYPFANNQDHEPYPHPEECEVIGNIYENPELLNA